MKSANLLSPTASSGNTINHREPQSVTYSRRYLLAALAIAVLLLLLLEFRSPYYFLQDDGLEEFLPYFVHNWHSLLAGKFPLYDFHIFAGVPHAAMGQPAVFYLPQYVAMFLSESIWRSPFATIDLMAFMHALIAVAGGYVLLRYLGATDMAAAFGGLTTLTGFFVWAGRMWPSVLMLCAWFPWMVWASLRYLEKPSVGRAGWLMSFRLALLYGGYPHFFILAMIFEHLFALSHSAVSRRPDWGARYLGYVALIVPTLLLGFPFLLPGIVQAEQSLERAKPMPYSEFSHASLNPIFWIFGQLLVFIPLRVPKNFANSAPYLSYIGYFATLLSFGAGTLWKKRPARRPWIIAGGICFGIALAWSWNVGGPLLYHVPVLNRLRWPFKLIYFAGFFQCTIAALVLTLWSKRWQRIAIAGLIVNWIIVFCFLPNHAWRVREHHPPLKSPWQDTLKDGRYFVISSGLPNRVSNQFVIRDYAEMWDFDNLLGYEPLIPRLNAKVLLGKHMTNMALASGAYNGVVDHSLLIDLKKWCVRYVLVGPSRTYVSGKLAAAGFHRQAAVRGWALWDDPNASFRVHWTNAEANVRSSAGIRWVEHVNSIDVYLSEWPSPQLVFAFVDNPGFEVCISGHCSPIARSPDGLIRVHVPPDTRHVRLVYSNGLFLPSILVALVTLVVYLLLLLRSRRTSHAIR